MAALNNGHFGSVRFITSVEIAKNYLAQSATPGSETAETIYSAQNYKTVVISGGEGYEVYKNTVNLNPTSMSGSASNSGASSGQQKDGQSDACLSTSGVMNSLNLPNVVNSPNTLQPQPQMSSNMSTMSSSNVEDLTLGKDDLINYVLTWEI